MNVVDKPGALPGSCVMPACGSASRDKYIDTGLQFEFYGAVYICNLCLGEMARMLGFLEPEYVDALKAKNEELETDKYLLQRRVDGLELVVNGFTLARGTGGADSVGSALATAGLADEEPARQGEDLGEGTVGSPEQMHDERVAKLSDDGSGHSFQLHI